MSPSTRSSAPTPSSGYGLIMATGPDEFLGAGKGFRVSLPRLSW